MAAEKQVNSERVAGKKRSRNKFKQNERNVAAQPSTAAQQHLPDKVTFAANGASAVETLLHLPEGQLGAIGRNNAGAPAVNGTGEVPPSKRHKKDKVKQHVEQGASVAMRTDPVAAKAVVHVSSDAAALAPAVLDGHAAAKKRSKNKFKQPPKSDTVEQTMNPAVLEPGKILSASNDATMAAAAPAELGSGQGAARKRSKNKFKMQGSSTALAQQIHAHEGSLCGTLPQSDSGALGHAQARANAQPPQLCTEEPFGGVPARGPAGRAGQRIGQPGTSYAKVGASQPPSSRGHSSRNTLTEGEVRGVGPVSDGVPAGSQNRHAGRRNRGPGAEIKQRAADETAAQKRGSEAAVLPHETAVKERGKKRRRKAKGTGAVAQPEAGVSVDDGSQPGLGKAGTEKSVRLPTVVAPPPKGVLFHAMDSYFLTCQLIVKHKQVQLKERWIVRVDFFAY